MNINLLKRLDLIRATSVARVSPTRLVVYDCDRYDYDYHFAYGVAHLGLLRS